MRNLSLLALLVASPASAQEFSIDPAAMANILSQMRVIKVKHSGRPPEKITHSYSPKDLRFELDRDGAGREDGVVYINRTIRILHKDSPLAYLYVNSEVRGSGAAQRLLKAFEALRQRALEQNQLVIIDYDAIERQNKTGAWDAMNPKECELFDEIIRTQPRAVWP